MGRVGLEVQGSEEKPMKDCEACDLPAIDGERFCKDCKKAKIEEMKRAGYLKPAPQHGTPWRTPEHMEDTRETKRGIDR